MTRADGNTTRPVATLIDLLRWRAERQADRPAFAFLRDGERDEVGITYGELDRQARAIGAWLQGDDATLGRPVLVLCPPGLDFIAAFFGCLYGGAIAVPSFPPHPARRTRTASRLDAIVENARPAAILTTSELRPAVEPLLAGLPEGSLLAVDELVASDPPAAAGGLAERWQPPDVGADALAMLQYTSGSTGAPNGVMLSHGNLLHNSEQIRRCFRHSERSRGLIWLPPYHDMGLIGGILQPLYVGFPVTLMSPMHFLQQPIRWLRAVSDTGATTSGGPNFAYELCVERITPEQRAGLDLSRWDLAFTGAEPVRAETMERFAAAFAPCGFRREVFYPCYGLAEATLIVSGGAQAAPPVAAHVAGDGLRDRRVIPVTPEALGALCVVGCGGTVDDQEIAIVDPDQQSRCPPAEVGEIWVRGPSVARGYWGRPDQTEHTFGARLAGAGAAPFLRTGDLGFVQDGELFVTGRLKDLIILNGQNHYPQDIEATAERSHAGLRPGCCAAFSVERSGAERLVVVAEVERAVWSAAQRREAAPAVPELQSVCKAIRRAVSERHDARVAEVCLLKPAGVPKTPSGKLQRRACREAYLGGTLSDVLAVG